MESPSTTRHGLPSPPLSEPRRPSGLCGDQTAIVAVAVAPPSHMSGMPDPLAAPPSFTARRPNASNLPNFELPPPPPQYKSFAPINSSQASSVPPGSITSVGNLLTPPSNIPGDGLSPMSGITSNGSNSTHGIQPYTPNGYAGWSPHTHQGNSYGFHQQNSNPQSYGQQGQSTCRPAKLATKPVPTNSFLTGLPQPPYEVNLPPFSTSGPMSAGPMSAPATLPTMSSQSMMNSGQMTTAPPQPSPAPSQDGFPHRPPHTPTYYPQSATTPQGPSFPYSTGPSPTQQSPVSAPGAMTRMSPQHTQGPVPTLQAPTAPQHPYQHQRPYGAYHPLPGPVLSNVSNPNGQLALVGAMQHGMMPGGFNSGHAASMGMYAAHSQQQQPPSDRPFKCDQCPQSFNRNHDLKRHKRIHLAVKPFPCGHCDKSFSRKDALKVRFFFLFSFHRLIICLVR